MPSDRWSGWQLWARTVAFVATYVALTAVAYRVAWQPGIVTPLWWPPSGLAIGVLMRAPRRAWLPLLGTLGGVMLVLGLLGLPSPRHPPPLIAVLWAISDVCVPLLGASLLRKFGGLPFTLQRPREVMVFLLCAVIPPPFLSASIILLGWSLWPGVPPRFELWGPWWTGEAMGILSFAPLLLTFPVRGERLQLSKARLLENAGLGISLILFSVIAFEIPNHGLQIIALAFATSPLLAWAAIRFGARGAAAAAVVLAVVSTSRTLAGRGPFVSPTMFPYESTSYSAAYFALAAISSLLLAAFAMERRRAAARRRLVLEAASVLAEPAPLQERLRRVTDVLVSTELARAAEVRTGEEKFISPIGRPPFADPLTPEVRILSVEFDGGGLKLEAIPQLGYFDAVDVQTSVLVATRIADALENDRLLHQVDDHVRQNEETLALLDAVLRSAPLGIALLDPERRFIRVNEAMARISGLAPTDHLGKRIPEVYPGVGGAELDGRLRQVLETGEPVIGAEFEGVSADHPGEKRVWMLTWFPITIAGKPPLGVCSVVVDATERKRQEVELRSSEERFRRLAEGTAEIIFTTDRQGIPQRGAGRWTAFTGQSAEDYRSERWLEVVHPEDRDRVRKRLHEGLRTGESVTLSFRMRYRDGSWRNVEYFEVPLRDSTGRIRETVGAISDVTERTRAEEARERALTEAQEALRVRDDFLSVASHELKTPLTPLSVRLEVMQQRLEAGQPIEPSSIAKARAALNRLTFLIGDLLDVSRIRSARMATSREPVSLLEVVREVVDSYPPSLQPHRLDVRLPDENLWLLGDRPRLVQVLDNLVDNAIKFSPHGGIVSISLRAEGGQAVLSVSDEGIGIPPEDQAGLFDRFSRARNASARSYGGLGLGLNICREIVEYHGGRIWLESEVGHGSTFHVALPLLIGAEVAAHLH